MSGWPRRWRARWIWWDAPDLDAAFARGEPPPRPLDGFGYLRRGFTAPRAPRRARCRVTADARYVLWVNGTYVGRGPVRSYPWAWTYDEYDIASLLVAGRNAIAALCRHYGGPTNAWVPAAPVGSLGFGSFLLEAEIDGELLASDGSWRAREAPYERRRHHEGPPPPEILDGRAIAQGWTDAGFDDAAWPRAMVLDASAPGVEHPWPPADPFPSIEARPTPPPADRLVEGEGTGLVDFGAILNAHPIIEVEAAPGTIVEARCGEALDAAGKPVTDVRDWRLRYTVAGAPGETVESFEPVGFRYVSVRVLAGDARAIRVSARERVHLRAPGARFACSDPALTAVWETAARTLEVCSADAFIDGPGREARAWLGDAYGHTLTSLYVHPDARMAARMLRLHARGARPDGLLPMVAAADFSLRAQTIPDHSLLWVLALALVHRHTGDGALLEELRPVALRALDWFEQRRGEHDLLAGVPGWVFMDWAQHERDTHLAPLDALYVLALDALAPLCADERTIGDLRARAARTRAAFDRYWDPARGVYVDAADAGGRRGRRVSQLANALAMESGVAPEARWDGMLSFVLDPDRVRRTRTPGDPGTFAERLASQTAPLDPSFDEDVHVIEAQPFASHFLHAAVTRAGRIGALLGLIRRWDGFGSGGCFPEYWDARAGMASMCHAWSAVPLYDLSATILGVTPGEPGWHEAIVAPHLGDLEWCEGSVPTPLGSVSVSVTRDGGVTVDAPPGMRVVEREEPRYSGGGAAVLPPGSAAP